MGTYQTFQGHLRRRVDEKIELHTQAMNILHGLMQACVQNHDFPANAFRVQSAHTERNYAEAEYGSIADLTQNESGFWTCFLFVTVAKPGGGEITFYLDPEIGFTAVRAELGWKGNPNRILADLEISEEAIAQYANVLVAQIESGLEGFTGRIFSHDKREMGYHMTMPPVSS